MRFVSGLRKQRIERVPAVPWGRTRTLPTTLNFVGVTMWEVFDDFARKFFDFMHEMSDGSNDVLVNPVFNAAVPVDVLCASTASTRSGLLLHFCWFRAFTSPFPCACPTPPESRAQPMLVVPSHNGITAVVRSFDDRSLTSGW
jgi:hypothetical protein